MSDFEFKVINRHLMLTRESSQHSWRVEPNIFEAVKAERIWDAKDSAAQYLPRFPVNIDESRYPDLCAWRISFTSDNPPEVVSFSGRDKELAEDLAGLDFSKSFDQVVADRIRLKYRKHGKRVADVDADLIIQGELGELES